MEIQERVQQLVTLAGKPERMDDFTTEASALLTEITMAALRVRAIADAQVQWMQGQAGQRAREN